MKILLIIISLIHLQINAFCTEEILTLKDALAKKKITCNLTGNSSSPHYYQPLIINITNSDNEPIKIKIENGQKFIASDESYQNLILTKQELILLNPKQSKKIELFSMCIESQDHAPIDRIIYSIGEMASGTLLKLTQLIEKKSWFNYMGQNAVWCLINNDNLENIAGFDDVAVNEVVKFLAKETGKPLPPAAEKDDYKRNFHSQKIISTVKGVFKYTIAKTRAVSIILIDQKGIVVRELYNNPKEKAGDHNYEFQFDSTVYKDDNYIVKLIADGRVLTEKKITIR